MIIKTKINKTKRIEQNRTEPGSEPVGLTIKESIHKLSKHLKLKIFKIPIYTVLFKTVYYIYIC